MNRQEDAVKEELSPAARWGLAAIAIGALGVTMLVAMYSALVALVPLAVAMIPTFALVARSRRRRQVSESRDWSDRKTPIESSDWYRRELMRRGRIIDDRVA